MSFKSFLKLHSAAVACMHSMTHQRRDCISICADELELYWLYSFVTTRRYPDFTRNGRDVPNGLYSAGTLFPTDVPTCRYICSIMRNTCPNFHLPTIPVQFAQVYFVTLTSSLDDSSEMPMSILNRVASNQHDVFQLIFCPRVNVYTGFNGILFLYNK